MGILLCCLRVPELDGESRNVLRTNGFSYPISYNFPLKVSPTLWTLLSFSNVLTFFYRKPKENCKTNQNLTISWPIQYKQLSQNLERREDEEDDVCPTCFHGKTKNIKLYKIDLKDWLCGLIQFILRLETEYTEDNPKIVLQCGHIFHLACIYEWMERSQACPFCSKVLYIL